MHFVDEVTVAVRSGDGGDGCTAWRREPYVPRGGPAGGDGGRGGDVVLVADGGLRTLLDLRYKKHLDAGRGAHGRGKNQTGARGRTCSVRVPAGTLVYDAEDGTLLADLTEDGQRAVVAHGGAGGRGNARFATPTHRAPDTAEAGSPGEARHLRLELKLLADVGVVGLPNAGKSTLISRLSHARPRIAEYPFTTLVPNLGVVEEGDLPPFVIADIPGLVEGAHAGAGLGHRFLRHIERTAVLLYLVDHDPEAGRDAGRALDTLREELRRYDPSLAERPAVVALNKVDLPAARAELATIEAAAVGLGAPFHPISAATGEGLPTLVRTLAAVLARDEPPEES